MNPQRHFGVLLALALAVLAVGCGDDDTATTSPSTATAASAATVSAGPTTTATGAAGATTATGASPAPGTTTAATATTAAGNTTTTTAAAGTAGAAFPVTVAGDNGPVTLPARPQRIVSLSATHTEMLFAVGAGGQVVAVDDQSNYPPEAPHTSLSGFQPNIEAIAAYDPDLVVVFSDTGDLVAALGKVGIPVLLLNAPAALDGAYAQVEVLGAATGHVAEAAALVASMTTEVKAVVDRVPTRDRALTYYHELDDQYFSVTSSTFIGQVYSLLGLQNIADQAPGAAAAGGYPQLSAEYIVAANPDLIFLADTKCCQQSAATVAARPGWGSIAAVTNGGVVPLDDDLASRWGPRVVDYLDNVATRVEQLQPVG